MKSMNKVTAFERFEKLSIKPLFAEALCDLEVVFQEEKEQFKKEFIKIFQKACLNQKKIAPEQECAYIMLEFLRTNLLFHRYQYRIMFYGTKWYMKSGIFAGEFDVSVILECYHKLEEKLKEAAKRYVGKISPLEIESHLQRLLTPFQEYIKELILYAITDAVETEEFQKLNKAKELQIRVGECLEPGNLIYLEQKEKDREKIIEWLQKNLRETYCFQDFQFMDFSGMDFTFHDFRYTDFRDSMLEKADMKFSLLNGAKFRRTCLEYARFSGSMMHAVDFTEAKLQGAHLDYTICYDGKDSSTNWKLVGYPKGSFSGADLQGTNFTGCIYCGVNFCGANVNEANFHGASLYRCCFTEEQVAVLSLTEEQRGQICICK